MNLLGIRLDRQYFVTHPDGRYRNNGNYVSGEEVLRLPHWKHCDVVLRSDILTFKLKQKQPDVFEFGRAIRNPMQELRVQKEEVQAVEYQLQRAQEDLAETKRLAVIKRRDTISAVKYRGNERYSYDRIREVLMKDEAVLDVRLPGEAWDGSGLGVGNLVSQDSLVVTFIGPCIRGQHGVVPLPPVQYVLARGGDFTGGTLAIGPHVRVKGSCGGNMVRALDECRRNGDTYGVVDLLRVLRLSYNSRSLLNHDWKNHAWDWWCARFSQGWPTTEPFQKPWLQWGMTVQDNRKGGFKSLAASMGAESPESMLTALHIGRDAGWYSRSRYSSGLREIRSYVPLTERESFPRCLCGAIPPSEIDRRRDEAPTLSPLACQCHSGATHNPQTYYDCPTCGRDPIACRCVWSIRTDWHVTNEPSTGFPCGRCSWRNSDHPAPEHRQFFVLRATNLFGLRRVTSPRYICEECLPPAVEEQGAEVPQSVVLTPIEQVIDPEEEDAEEEDGRYQPWTCAHCGRENEYWASCGNCELRPNIAGGDFCECDDCQQERDDELAQEE